MNNVKQLLTDGRFDFLSVSGREFIIAFDTAMQHLGYAHAGQISSGHCWGKYMLIYTKMGVGSRKVYARIYLRESGPVLRLFLNDIDKHRAFLENAPNHIKEPFTGPYGDCQHCHNEKEGRCRFRKKYTLNDRLIEKCNGLTFEFQQPTTEKIGDYLALFTKFHPTRVSTKLVN